MKVSLQQIGHYWMNQNTNSKRKDKKKLLGSGKVPSWLQSVNLQANSY